MPGFRRVTVIYVVGLILMEILTVIVSDHVWQAGGVAFMLGVFLASFLVPALAAGLAFGRHAGRAALPDEAWRYAGWFTVLQSAVLAGLLLFAMQDFLREESDGAVILVVIVAAVAGLCLIVSRMAFPMGARRGAGAGRAA